MSSVIKDARFERVIDFIKPDTKNRITLGSVISQPASFSVYRNETGQIVLDPVALVPESEAWLFKNKKALARVREGIGQAGRGETHDLGSFAQYADD
jgi:hypothetical protein